MMNGTASTGFEPLPSPGRSGWPWAPTAAAMARQPRDLRWPRISIVTPSFNQGRYLEETIRSVLLQGYPNLEYIVIDGASTDGSLNILQKYAPHLAYWISESDGGCAEALNKGLGRASGAIFGFINSDDVYEPGVLFDVARYFLDRPHVDVLSGHGSFIDGDGHPMRMIRSDEWSLRRFAYGASVLVQPATFVRRAVAHREAIVFNEANKTCWDAEFWADLAIAGARFGRAEATWARFRLHGGSITGSGRLAQQYRIDRQRLFTKILGRRRHRADKIQEVRYRLEKCMRRMLTGGSRRSVTMASAGRSTRGPEERS
jgi:glycosyltransferase involved in cell wall biosynthesis